MAVAQLLLLNVTTIEQVRVVVAVVSLPPPFRGLSRALIHPRSGDHA